MIGGYSRCENPHAINPDLMEQSPGGRDLRNGPRAAGVPRGGCGVVRGGTAARNTAL